MQDIRLDTYCILTLQLVALTQLLLLSIILQFVSTLVLVAVGKFSSPDVFRAVILFVYRVITNLNYFLLFTCYYLQIIEWSFMRFLMRFEQKINIQQLTYIINNTKDFNLKE